MQVLSLSLYSLLTCARRRNVGSPRVRQHLAIPHHSHANLVGAAFKTQHRRHGAVREKTPGGLLVTRGATEGLTSPCWAADSGARRNRLSPPRTQSGSLGHRNKALAGGPPAEGARAPLPSRSLQEPVFPFASDAQPASAPCDLIRAPAYPPWSSPTFPLFSSVLYSVMLFGYGGRMSHETGTSTNSQEMDGWDLQFPADAEKGGAFCHVVPDRPITRTPQPYGGGRRVT